MFNFECLKNIREFLQVDRMSNCEMSVQGDRKKGVCSDG